MQRSSTSRTKGIGDRGAKKLPLSWIALLCGLALLLVMVAALQYRWTKQLSEATEARIGSALQPLMMGWHLDFYGELSAICVALQVGPDSTPPVHGNLYLRRYLKCSHAPIKHDLAGNRRSKPDFIKY